MILIIFSEFVLMILIIISFTIVPGSDSKFTLHLNYLLIGVTINRFGVLSSWLLYQNYMEQ